MKRIILGILFVLAAVCCLSCGPAEKTSAKKAQVCRDGGCLPVMDADAVPSLVMQRTYYMDNYVVQIPKAIGIKGADADKMNAQFDALAKEFDAYDKSDKNKSWLEWRTSLYPSRKYLQVVMTRNEYPIYGTDGDIYSWNYDIGAEKLVELNDAYKMYGAASKVIKENVEKFVKKNGSSMTVKRVDIKAFRMLNEYSVDFYCKAAEEAPGADSWDTLYTVRWNKASKDCDVFAYSHDR